MPRKQKELSPKKKTKEKSPKKSEDPKMDEAAINQLLQNALNLNDGTPRHLTLQISIVPLGYTPGGAPHDGTRHHDRPPVGPTDLSSSG